MLKNPVAEAVEAVVKSECWVGIDVAKVHLDVVTWPAGERRRVARDEAGLMDLTGWLSAQRPALIVLEATGGLEVTVVTALVEAGLPAAVINPRQARDFAKATGRLAKTDVLDAEVLARFGAAIHPEPRPWKDAATQALTALIQRRRQLVEMRVAEQNRLASAHRPSPTGYSGYPRLARRPPEGPRWRPPAPVAGESGLARTGRLAARRSWYRPGDRGDAPGRPAGTRDPEPAPDQRPGWGLPVQSRFRSVPGPPDDLRRAGRCSRRAVHGRRHCQPV